MTRRVVAGVLPMVAALASAAAARADVTAGAQLARQWCASCHLVAAGRTGAVPQGPPSFAAVAQSGLSRGRLAAFLSHPHGAMPDLVLTRAEIDNLIDYIESLR